MRRSLLWLLLPMIVFLMSRSLWYVHFFWSPISFAKLDYLCTLGLSSHHFASVSRLFSALDKDNWLTFDIWHFLIVSWIVTVQVDISLDLLLTAPLYVILLVGDFVLLSIHMEYLLSSVNIVFNRSCFIFYNISWSRLNVVYDRWKILLFVHLLCCLRIPSIL
jgi:hypothetical protein